MGEVLQWSVSICAFLSHISLLNGSVPRESSNGSFKINGGKAKQRWMDEDSDFPHDQSKLLKEGRCSLNVKFYKLYKRSVFVHPYLDLN